MGGLDLDTTVGNSDVLEELVELFIVADGEGKVTLLNALDVEVAGEVTRELENLGGEVLKDSREVHGGAGADALGVTALLQETMDTTNRELKVGARRARLGAAALGLARLSSTRHDCSKCVFLSKCEDACAWRGGLYRGQKERFESGHFNPWG